VTEKSLRIGDKELRDSLLVKATKTAAAEQKQEQPDTSTPKAAYQDRQRLAQLVIAYQEKFGRYVPARVLRLFVSPTWIVLGHAHNQTGDLLHDP
jgi:hypothetical protein